MTVMEDILDELYTLNSEHWSDNIRDMLNTLNYKVSLSYVCDWSEFLYIHSKKINRINSKDKAILNYCYRIAGFSSDVRYGRLHIFGVKLRKLEVERNELACELCKLFRKMYGRYTILIINDGDEIAFTGTFVDNKQTSEVIISDWFGYYKPEAINNRIMGIDCSLFAGNTLTSLYDEYLWGIARPYIKYPESKDYYTFGCDDLVLDGVQRHSEFSYSNPKFMKVDRKETYRINSAYYPDLYGEDYFVDKSHVVISDNYLDNDISDEEWTILELEMKNIIIEEDDLENSNLDNHEGIEDDYSVLDSFLGSDMNPVEMLDFIQT